MPQLTVSIEDASMLDQIRQAISLLRGVTSVSSVPSAYALKCPSRWLLDNEERL